MSETRLTRHGIAGKGSPQRGRWYKELHDLAIAADDGFAEIEKELSESMVGHGMPTPLHDKLTAILAKCRAHRLAAGRGE